MLPTPLLGLLPELGESTDLRPPRLAETHLGFSWHLSSGTPHYPHTPRLAPLPTSSSRTHYLQIFIAPSPSQIPSPVLGSAVEKAGASPLRVGGSLPTPLCLVPKGSHSPVPTPSQHRDCAWAAVTPPQPGVGGWGTQALRPPTSRPAPEVCGGRSAQSRARVPWFCPPPPPRAGEVGSEGRGSALQGQGKLRWAAGWGRGRQNPCILPPSRPPTQPPQPH